jgi:hypothetical protein
VSTCGRWAALRVALRRWSLKKFVDTFKSRISCGPDEFVTLLTLFNQ